MITRDVVFGKKSKSYQVTIASIEPRPFMAPALRKNAGRVFAGLTRGIASELKKEAARLVRKNKRKKKLRRK